MRRAAALLAAGAVVLGLVACAPSPTSGDVAPPGAPSASASPYDGPLQVPAPAQGAAALPAWPGAAGRAVGCSGVVTGGSHAAPYGDGEVRESIGPALEQAIGEGQVGSLTGSLRQVRRQGSRVLLTRTEAGRVVEAVVMRHGTVAPRAGAGPDGIAWWPESWAQCDWADYSEATTAARGLQVWRTAAGSRVATTSIVSATGSEHCGWQRMTILQLGPALGGGTFVRDPLPELHASFEKPFRAHAPVPADARDTGLRRGGRTLWLPADGSVAYVGSSRADAEQWPATSRPLGCA